MSSTARTLAAALALALFAACSGSQSDVPPVTRTPPPVDDPETKTDTTTTIDVLAAQPTEILLDGKSIGTTPIQAYKVSPGSHDVTFIDEANGNRTMGVEVAPGDSKIVQSDPVPSASDTPKGEKGEKDDKKK